MQRAELRLEGTTGPSSRDACKAWKERGGGGAGHERPQQVKNARAEVEANPWRRSLGWEVPVAHFRQPTAHFLPTREPDGDTCSSNSDNKRRLGTERFS